LTPSFVADRGDHRRRVDHVIVRHLAGLEGVSRTRVQLWVAEGLVSVDGRRASRPAQHVRRGQHVEVAVDLPEVVRVVAAQPIPLSVIFEDAHLFAIDKPAGLIVHPSFAHRDGTLVNALAEYARDWPSGRPSLVQRLDKLTSGLLLVAKTPAVHAAAARALNAGGARKEYLALVYGRLRRSPQMLRYPLGRDPRDRRRVVVREDGREAITEVTRIAEGRGAARGLTLLRCRLVTGRTHQIRVHLRACGLPIVGDPVYGDPGWQHVRDASLAMQLRAFPRQALHAWRLTIVHPVTGAPLRLEAPVPVDLKTLMEHAGLSLPADDFESG
jgi:23S rRNA pseudouridine1911/1915/1917 synthase